ncbi:MAG TPA: serine protease [Candidatus Acidoferrum sp.]|nr:serine protease [Candidatus Acidoferrum sp.]
MPEHTKSQAARFVALLACLFCGLVAAFAAQEPAEDASLSAAVCPIVYQLDQTPASRGYRYSFFGNGFFINEEGYILTVAHVLETFRDGGQPYVLVSRPDSPPQLLRAEVIAVDKEHDVAILRATPNPFAGKHKVAFLPLASDPAVLGQHVLALSLHPQRPQNAKSFQAPQEERASSEVLSYESTKLEKSAPATDVFLLSHPVTLGQSGSPVLAQDSQAVVGLIEGRWLRSSGLSVAASRSASVPGAAIPIRYAIALLQHQSIAWHTSQLRASSSPSR